MTFERRFLKQAAKFGLFVVQLFGFWPYRYNEVHQRLETTWFRQLYTIIAPIAFISTTMYTIEILFNDDLTVQVQYETDAGNAVQNMFSISCVVIFITGYIVSMWHRHEVATKLVPRAIQIIKNIQRRKEIVGIVVRRSDIIFKLYLKNTIITACVFISEFLKVEFYAPKAREYPFLKVIIIIPFMIFSVLPNTFAIVMLMVTYGYRRLNAEIEQLVREKINLEQNEMGQPNDDNDDEETTRRPYCRMTKLCDLSDRLDELAVLHMDLGQMTKSFNRMISTYLFIWSWHRMTYFISQLFFSYQMASSIIKAETQSASSIIETNNVEIILYGVASALLILMDFYLFANICFHTEKEVGAFLCLCEDFNIFTYLFFKAQRSVEVLHGSFLIVDTDIRYTRSVSYYVQFYQRLLNFFSFTQVELFTAQIIHHKLNLTVCGMYSLDYSLVFSVKFV